MSTVGTNFRKWANERLTEYMTKVFTMNDDLLKRAGVGIWISEKYLGERDMVKSKMNI